jgi:hypothetical protein
MYTDELGRLPLHGQFNFFSDVKPLSAPAPGQFVDQSSFSVGSLSNNGQFMTGSGDLFETGDASLFGVPSTPVSPTFTGVDPHAFLRNPESRQAPNEQPWSPTVSFDPSHGLPSPTYNPAYAMWSNVPTTFGYVNNLSGGAVLIS